MANPQNLQPPFVKGDKRINRKGRPKSFDALRKLAIKIAGENLEPENITRIEAMLRVMSSSRNPADRALFLAYAYGKPKEQLDLTSGGEAITFIVERLEDGEKTSPTIPSPT
jgi:hypothetical protein